MPDMDKASKKKKNDFKNIDKVAFGKKCKSKELNCSKTMNSTITTSI